MARRRATWRASSTVSGEQQLPNRRTPASASAAGSCHGQTRSVTPTTSWPCSTRSAAPPRSRRRRSSRRRSARESSDRFRALRSTRRATCPRSDRAGGRGPRARCRRSRSAVALVADEAHARRELLAQRVLQRRQLGAAARRTARADARRPLHVSSVRRTDHECARISSLSLSCSAMSSARSARACPIVSRPERRSAWMSSGSFRSRSGVGNAAAVLAHALPELLLRPVEVGEEPLIGLRLFERIQVSLSRFSTRASSRLSASVASRMTAGMRSMPASLAARHRRSPTMSWYPCPALRTTTAGADPTA